MSTEMKVIVFNLGHEEYAVEVSKVKTIERMQALTHVPQAQHFIKGVINLRGVVTPIVDIRERFGYTESTYTDTTRIIIVTINGADIGMIVDSANDVMDIDTRVIDEPPKVVGGIDSRFLKGIAKIGNHRLLILLDLEETLGRKMRSKSGTTEAESA